MKESEGSPHLLGLAFEPVRRRTTPDIEGTLWLERETGKLLFLEFTYDWAPWAEADGVAGGRVEFQEMPSGAWIVRKWWIRMPRMAQVRAGIREVRSALRVVGIAETGGEVIQVSSLDRHVVSQAQGGSVAGLAWDSLHHGPLSGATVFLSGTQYSTRTDSGGHFLLDEVPEGRYTVAFSHPVLDSLGIFPPGSELTVLPGEATEVLVAVPSRGSILSTLCGGLDPSEGEGAVTGTVRQAGTGSPLPGATVRLEWKTYSVPGGVQIREDVQALEVSADQGGRFRACGIPPGSRVTARASHQQRNGPPQTFEVGRDQVVVIRLELDPSRLIPGGRGVAPAPPSGSRPS